MRYLYLITLEIKCFCWIYGKDKILCAMYSTWTVHDVSHFAPWNLGLGFRFPMTLCRKCGTENGMDRWIDRWMNSIWWFMTKIKQVHIIVLSWFTVQCMFKCFLAIDFDYNALFRLLIVDPLYKANKILNKFNNMNNDCAIPCDLQVRSYIIDLWLKNETTFCLYYQSVRSGHVQHEPWTWNEE